jgi:hypothetical protein
MKKLIVTTIAAVGLATGAFAQGTLDMGNASTGGYINDYQGNAYVGSLAFQIFVVSAGLDGQISDGTLASAVSLYNSVISGATFGAPELSISGASSSGQAGYAGDIIPGVFSYGTGALPHVALGGSAELALVFFTGTAWGAPGGQEGVVVFHNGTGGDGSPIPNPPVKLVGWDAAPLNSANLQLALVPVPEPATFALAGLGAAAMLIFRRRK